MKKKITAMILAGTILLSMTSCSSGSDRSRKKHHRDRDRDRVEETTEETTEPAPTTAPTVTPVPASNITFRGDTDYTPVSDAEFIVPYTYGRTNNSSMNSWDTSFTYSIGFVDENGEAVCDPIFNVCYLLSGSNNYAVGMYDDNMELHYGLISLDGTLYTGLRYDGVYEVPARSHDDAGYIYLSNYDDGIMHVEYMDYELNTIIEDREIVIDESQFEYFDPSYDFVCERLYDADRAIVKLSEASYGTLGDYLIDTTTGEVLCSFTSWLRPIITDTMIISSDPMEDIEIFDLDGNDITGDYVAAYSLSHDRIVLFTDSRVDVIDPEGNIMATAELGDHYSTDVCCGNILIGTAEGIEIYDQDMNLITVSADHYLDYGLTVDDFYEFREENVIFNDYADDTYLYNLTTGGTTTLNPDYSYSGECGYIVGDDQMFGDVAQHVFSVYDYDLNSIWAGGGEPFLTVDRIKGDVYLIAVDGDNTIIYRLTDSGAERLYDIQDAVNGYSAEFVNGMMFCTQGDTNYLYSADGEVVFSCIITDC